MRFLAILTTLALSFLLISPPVFSPPAFALSLQEDHPGVRGEGSFVPSVGGGTTRALSKDQIRQILIGEHGNRWEGETFWDEYLPDGTYKGVYRGEPYSGKWELTGGSEMCFLDADGSEECYLIAYDERRDRVYFFDSKERYSAYADREELSAVAEN